MGYTGGIKGVLRLTESTKPGLVSSIEQQTFWEHALRHELRMQKCPACGYIRYPSSIICPRCHSTGAPDWVELSGRGTVYSLVVFHHVYKKALAGEVPYTVATVELEDGPRMMGRIKGLNPDDVSVGMKVELYFEDAAENLSLPQFRPARES